MKISIDWLRDYVDLPADLTPSALAHHLTMRTVEVEQVVDLAAPLDQVIAARIVEVAPHPNADRLRVCTMHDGRTVVCGGSNVRPDMLVALALPGAVCTGGDGSSFTIAESKVRGVASSGMICAGEELGLADLLPTTGKEISDLSGLEVAAGTPLASAIGFDDVLLEIDNKSLTNRPDLWGHYGIARELAAMFERSLKPLPRFDAPSDHAGLSIQIEDPARCRRFTMTKIAGLKTGESPMWLRSRLARVGQRPINLLVDLTNYVMMAVGQPSHAFDARDLPEGVRIRGAVADEPLTLLNGESLVLEPGTLIVASHDRPMALAGVMGGEHAVRDDTEELWLEVANFTAIDVRRSSRRYGVRSESSSRNEKGLDCERIDAALGTFQALFADLAPDARFVAHVDQFPNPWPKVTVRVDIDFLQRRLGRQLPSSQVRALLERLGFDATGDAQLEVAVPSWRATGDVDLPEDIVEEIARLYGYEELGFTPPRVALTAPVIQPQRRMDRRLREYLAFRAGLREVVTYPWVDANLREAAGLADVPCLGLAHPPAPGQRLAVSLVPQMLHTIASNLRHLDRFGAFELNRVFSATREDGPEALPQQPRHLVAAWVGPDVGELYYRAKGVIGDLARHVQTRALAWGVGEPPPWADPKAHQAILADDTARTPIGHIAALHPRTRRLAGIRRAETVVVELNVDALEPHPSRENKFAPLPKYPTVSADLSVVLERGVQWTTIESHVGRAHGLVQNVRFVDEYVGPQVGDAHKSLTLSVTLGSSERTLVRDEVEMVMQEILAELQREFGAQLRPG
ncbi:MAG: phenylalanine--tRNA ligase subunit beta [Myxococcales bacterium FL481]|nr:MAG: phenylalanine--tRNA ligase subunit beta [Myxococcales bacterium FL481]